MAQAEDTRSMSNSKDRFKELSDIEKKELLDGKDRKSTQHATNSAVCQLTVYLEMKNKLKIEDISVQELNCILEDFLCCGQTDQN